jgi:anthranilate synthase
LAGHTTRGLPRTGEVLEFKSDPKATATDDHPPGSYAAKVRKAKEKFKAGDLFETVLSQTFFRQVKPVSSNSLVFLCSGVLGYDVLMF